MSKTIEKLERQNGELRKENERLGKRDCNANIELCFNDGFYPFARESLKIVDVGVLDNTYVVESETVSKLQQELTELKAKYEDKKLDSIEIDITGVFNIFLQTANEAKKSDNLQMVALKTAKAISKAKDKILKVKE